MMLLQREDILRKSVSKRPFPPIYCKLKKSNQKHFTVLEYNLKGMKGIRLSGRLFVKLAFLKGSYCLDIQLFERFPG